MADSVIQAVTGKIMEYSVDALKKQANYLCFYSSNVQTLADELEDLKIRHESVQQDVDAARANFGVIRPEVEAWLKNVEELKSRSDEIRGDAEEIQSSSVRKWLPLLHYSLSRKAFKTAKDSVKLQNTKFDRISNPVIPAEIPPIPTTSYFDFESRKDIEDKIMDALNNPNVYLIGIWGVGGVGKTKMVKKIEDKVGNEKTLFEHVVMVVVSQQPDVPKLQSQIAKALGLTLSEDSPALRQKELHKRLMDEKSILIILDDLWGRLDLEELGISSQNKHCKLIITSRNKDALNKIGVQSIFQLEILTNEESWRFFKGNVGINDDDSHNELVDIAKKVERECKGLPLALKIVASALKDKEKYFWDNALEELKKSAPNNIPDVLQSVYQPLKYSFKVLESEGQKYLFLLCCLFPEDYSISIEELLGWGIGLRIFNQLNRLTGCRNELKTMLNILLSHSLLMEGNKYSVDFEVRMHDVIRDVGIWIATKEGMAVSNGEKQQFMIEHGLNECPSMTKEHSPNINNCTFISLHFSHSSVTFPKSIVYTKLELLRLDVVDIFRSFPHEHKLELPENIFNGMGELKVLEALRIGLLPPSIGELNRLHTLVLRDCNIFRTVSMLGKLINLEVLSLDCCEFLMLPIEIGRLKNLKQLKILHYKREGRIAFGVISKLTRLEELVILGSFGNWEAEAGLGGDGGGIACLCELDSLKKLTTLKIEIINPRVIPREKPLWVQNLESYDIAVSLRSSIRHRRFKKSIMLGKEVVNPLGNWVYDMASDAEYLTLEGSNCMIIVKWLSKNSGNLSCLKKLRLAHLTDIRYLAEGRQKGAIFPSMTKGDNNEVHQQDLIPQVAGMNFNFCGLTDLTVGGFGNFKCLFSPSIISGILNLTDLKVENCSMLEQVIGKDDENVGETISFPNLKYLRLKNLPNILTVCYNRIQMPSLDLLWIIECPQMVKFVEEHPNPTPFINNEQVCCPKLRHLWLKKLNISAVFSLPTFKSLTNLQLLAVIGCEELGNIIIKEEEGETAYEELTENFPLRFLNLRKLPKLRGSIVEMKHPLEFPSLDHIEIEDCPMLEKFSLGSVHLPKWEIIPFPEIHSEKNYFTISIEDLSLRSDLSENICSCLLPMGSSLSFVNVVRIPLNTKIVGKFKKEKIQKGIEYEIMLMIQLSKYIFGRENEIEIEMKIPGERKLRTEILKNQPTGIWTEMSIGKFMMREPQQINEEFEFSLRQRCSEIGEFDRMDKRPFIKGVKIVEV